MPPAPGPSDTPPIGALPQAHDYVARGQETATKTGTPIMETPQSVSVVTRRQIDDQNPQTVGNALRYTAGVLSDPDATSRYDSVFLRGFGAFGLSTNFVSFLDGLKLPRGQAFAQSSMDPFLLDRIEVIKGPSALLFGQIGPGGLVNQVNRRPSAVPYNEIRIEGGSYGRIQSGFTSQGALDPEGKWLYSLSGIGRMSGTRYDGVEEQRLGIAPALTWRPDQDTQLTIQGYAQRDPEGGYFNSIYPRQFAAPGFRKALGSRVNIGDPGFDGFRRDQYGIGYNFDHRFNDTLSIHSALRYSGVDTDFRSLQMQGPPSAGVIPRYALRSLESAQGLSMDHRAQLDFRVLGLDHKVLVGADYQDQQSSWIYQFGPASGLNLFAPRYNVPVGPLATVINSKQHLSQLGLYLQDEIKFGGFRLTLGVRHDMTDQETLNRASATRQEQSAERTSYRAGLLYLFENGVAPYVSYATSFEPVIGVDAAGSAFRPMTGEGYEVGVKYTPPGVNALFTFAAFDISQRNALTPGATPGFNVQQGEVRSKGLEFEARGNLTDSLELIGALTLLDTQVSRSTTIDIIGKRPQAVPDYYGSVWANYRFSEGYLAGLSVGAGLRFVGPSYGDDLNVLKAPSYLLVDAALRYDLSRLSQKLRGAEATLNVNNIFDEEYYTSCSSNFFCQYGNRRTVLGGLRYRW